MNTIEQLAVAMFNAYNAQGPNPNKTWDGKDVPPWEKLGDQVQGKWLAAAECALKPNEPQVMPDGVQKPSIGRIVTFAEDGGPYPALIGAERDLNQGALMLEGAPEFVAFPKIARWSREIIVTEKLDGTNAQVHVTDDGRVFAGSRNRWIAPGDDGFGFGAWVKTYEDKLRELGPGSHFGEWWGAGIQRKYNTHEKRFSLFNVHRWGDDGKDKRPACCHVVPVLYRGGLNEQQILDALERLRSGGSVAAPGFMNPEGVVIFHVASGALFKKTLDKDDEPKGART